MLVSVGGGVEAVNVTRRTHTRSSFRRRRCPRVTHTHGCVCAQQPADHPPPLAPTRTMGGNIVREAFPGDPAAARGTDGRRQKHIASDIGVGVGCF